MPTVISILFRLILVVAGLVMALSLAAAAAVLVAVWLLRAAWARLTGRPVDPFVVRIDPRQGFQNMYRRADAASRTPRADAVSPRRPIGDITDVEPRRPGA